MHCLLLLGEPRDYFLANVRGHRANPRLAGYSIHILSYDIDERIADDFRKLRDETKDNAVGNAISDALYTNAMIKHYRNKLNLLEDKVDFLIKYAGFGWAPSQIHWWSPSSVLAPLSVWSRREMAEVSKQHPTEVAERLYKYKDDRTLKMYGITDPSGYQDYVSGFTSEETRDALKDLRKTHTAKTPLRPDEVKGGQQKP